MKKSSAAVIGLFLLLYILPLGVRPIIIPDETRYAEIPREMLASEDWVVPHLNGLRYFEKPVLGYWLNAVSIMLFGENAFAVRFPSAMATGISALLLFIFVRRFAGGHSIGILAAAAFLTCLEVLGVGTFSVLDSLLSMFITGAMIFFFFAYMEEELLRRTVFLVLFGAFCGFSFLIKGFIAFAVPAVAILPFMIWEQKWKELFRVCWIPIVAAVMVALPWSVMIHLRDPDFWRYFFWVEHIKRFMSGHPQHPHPFWYFIPVLIGGALPWTALFPVAISGVAETRFKDSLVRFAVCWFLFPFLFFSASHGKLATYILPCFQPLAIVIAVGLMRYLEAGKRRGFNIGALSLAMITAILAIILVASQVSDFPGFRVYGPKETWKWAFGVVGLLMWALLSVLAARSAGSRQKLIIYCAAPLLFMFSAHFIMPDQSLAKKAPGKFLLRHADKVLPDTILVSDEGMVRAVCWFSKRDDVFLLNSTGELEYGLGYDDSKRRLLTFEQFKELVGMSNREKRVVLIAKTKHYAQYRTLFPKPVFKDIDGGFVFAEF
ncbi:MAG: phospholipid carrier-dependent glycosyltransferase [Pseudomonadota bacterium]